MLQRYNCIRVNEIIRKMTPRYEKEKKKLEKEIIEKELKLSNCTYKIVNNKNKEVDIKIDQLINSLSLDELKNFSKYLTYYIERNHFIYKEIPLNNYKTLKLEYKSN